MGAILTGTTFDYQLPEFIFFLHTFLFKIFNLTED